MNISGNTPIAASSGSHPKAPGSAGGYLLPSTPLRGGDIRLDYSQQLTPRRLGPLEHAGTRRVQKGSAQRWGAVGREARAMRSKDLVRLLQLVQRVC